MKTCLLLICPDGKQLLTNQANYELLVEFIDYFKINTQFVKVDSETKVLDIPQIAKIFCDSNYNANSEFVSKLSSDSAAAGTIADCGNSSIYIRKKIKELMLRSKSVTFKQICKMFENLNYSLAALNNHFKLVRQEMIASGWTITKVKNGLYEITKTEN